MKKRFSKEVINMNYTYVLQCADNTFYTGWTNDIKRRLLEHNSGLGAKYTKGRIPVQLVYLEHFPTKQEAMKREWQIKQMSRNEKIKLISSQEVIDVL